LGNAFEEVFWLPENDEDVLRLQWRHRAGFEPACPRWRRARHSSVKVVTW